MWYSFPGRPRVTTHPESLCLEKADDREPPACGLPRQSCTSLPLHCSVGLPTLAAPNSNEAKTVRAQERD